MYVSRFTTSMAFTLALALSGCTHAAPPSSDELDARLVTAAQLPAGWTVDDHHSQPPGRAPTDAPVCLPVGQARLFLDTSGAAAGAIATVEYTGGGGGWLGFEYLDSYSGDGAHAALEKLRSLAQQCGQPVPVGTGGTLQFTIAVGPALGDESLAFHSTVTTPSGLNSRHDALFIRSGHVLIVVATGPPTPEDDQATDAAHLTELATAAYAAYTK